MNVKTLIKQYIVARPATLNRLKEICETENINSICDEIYLIAIESDASIDTAVKHFILNKGDIIDSVLSILDENDK